MMLPKTSNLHGTSITDLEIREIWVPRDDNQIEFKPWLIYTIRLNPTAQLKVADFVQSELHRFPLESAHNRDIESLKKSIASYTNLAADDPNLPPRIIWFTLEELNALPTELVRRDGYTLGDSIGGIGYGRPREHNPAVAAEVESKDNILISPGILSRIPINVEGIPHFIFQLAEKNLRTKGELFYKPIGGHMKYTESLQNRFGEFGLERKFRYQPQDERDFAFFVSSKTFQSFRELFHAQVLQAADRWMIVPPEETLVEELEEELGPIHSSDGVPILSHEDLRPYDYQIG